MTAETISVGTEILMGQIVDTNAQLLGEIFARCGLRHVHRQTVGDNLERLTEALRLSLSRADVVVTIGGLGPTQDDLTRDGIAAALDDFLVHDEEIEKELREIFSNRRLTWSDAQLRQCQRPSCAEAIPNLNGTAPGLMCRKAGKLVIALPGPRSEFSKMLERSVAPVLGALQDDVRYVSQIIRVAGIGEAMLEKQLMDLIEGTNPTVAPYAKTAEVHLRVTASARTESEAQALVEPVVQDITQRLGTALYGFGGTSLPMAILDLLRARGETVSVVESCTGGGLGAALTSVPGASDAFMAGFLTYSNDLKTKLAGVPKELLETHGAVSAECACAMAEGGRSAAGTDWAVSITGIAGPDGGSEAKPVGLVFIGVAGPDGVEAKEYRFRGGREDIRERAVQSALIYFRTRLIQQKAP